MRLLDVVRQGRPAPEQRSTSSLSWDAYQQYFTFNGIEYPFGMQGTLAGSREDIETSYSGYARGALKANGIVFACIALRTRVFSEARFAWQRREQGRPQRPYTDQRLAILERPWPGGTTQDLSQRILLSADIAGNAYVTENRLRHLRILRPDWVTIIRGVEGRRNPEEFPDAVDSTLLGYLYKPGGPGSPHEPVHLLPEEVAHFAPDPDPEAMFRGMSWLTPVIREIQGDSAMTSHKNKFMENAATPNVIVRLDASVSPAEFDEFVEKHKEKHSGWRNAYETMFLGGGADVTVAGSDLKQLDFKVVQGHGETRIAAAAGVHPVVVGLSEGMQGSSLNAGNYAQARRNVADTTFHPLWRNAAGSLSTLLRPRTGEELIADTRYVPFLRQDAKDEAEIHSTQATSVNTLITAGFTPESAVEATTTGDFSQLDHTGLVSIQLQPPGANVDDEGRAVPANQVAGLLKQGWRIAPRREPDG